MDPKGVREQKLSLTPFFVERAAIGLQQGPDIVWITGTGRVVDEALQLEPDQPLRTDQVQAAHASGALFGGH